MGGVFILAINASGILAVRLGPGRPIVNEASRGDFMPFIIFQPNLFFIVVAGKNSMMVLLERMDVNLPMK